MTNNQYLKNILLGILVAATILLAPWWLSLIVLGLTLLISKNIWMVIGLAFFSDILYFQSGSSIFGIPFIMTLTALILAILYTQLISNR